MVAQTLHLHFIVRSSAPDSVSLTHCGQTWHISKEERDVSSHEVPEFVCISYAWGGGRVPSPLDNNHSISDNTVPALTAAMSARPRCMRFWIDAFCVPTEGDSRRATLASMGWIYSLAAEVICVLSPAARSIIDQISKSDSIDEAALNAMEKDEWVSRAWTYQEVVNSPSIFFTCAALGNSSATDEDSSHGLIDGLHFLNCIGYTLSRLPGTHLQKSHQFPCLDAFQELIADWRLAMYQERSALQVLTNMDRRTQERPQDRYYAMIGAISRVPPSLSAVGNACEEFMAICEGKGDYSLIFTATERETEEGRRWRPRSTANLQSLLPWHLTGESQPGHLDNEKGALCLDQMVELQMGEPDDSAMSYIYVWVSLLQEPGDEKLPREESIFKCLKMMGFKGVSSCLYTEAGYFFPWKPIAHSGTVKIMVSLALTWGVGAPGLACERHGQDVVYTPGALIGRVGSERASSVVLS
ncbi:hypothetical protein GJ744_004087 [Endocarpon pusillum]|uniref:Heterokaryon incompatibility domain-containing protein n=1 Tax=Endocarpon pusillum TaxID=364733 RepID=A0A8H7ANN3_9EURO|nr:hypothetical protein GJ744_004087 [Endocarpon pusillum]